MPVSIADRREELLEREYLIRLNFPHDNSPAQTENLQNIASEWEQLQSEVEEKPFHDKFLPFPRLPIELRTKVWKFSLVSRVIEFRYVINRTAFWDEAHGVRRRGATWSTRTYKTPATSQACSESRKVFLRNYTLFKARCLKGPPIYVNPTLDVIFVNQRWCDNYFAWQMEDFLKDLDSSSGDQGLVSKITKLAFDIGMLCSWTKKPEWTSVLSLFPGLEEVIIVDNIVNNGETWVRFNNLEKELWNRKHRRWGTTYPGFAGNETLLVPYHEYELLAWENGMAKLGFVKAAMHGKNAKWDAVRVSISKLLRGKDAEWKAPLVGYQSVRFGPANKHSLWDEWVSRNRDIQF